MCEFLPIPPECGQNTPPGLIKVEILPVEFIDPSSSFFLLDHNHAFSGTFATTTPWVKLPLKIMGCVWTENIVTDSQGTRYERSLVGSIKNLRPELLAQLQLYPRHRYVVRVTDRTNTVIYLSTPQWPMELNISATTNTNGAGSPSTQFDFRCVSLFTAMVQLPPVE